MRAAPSLSQALQGQVAGLMMTQSSPQAGAAPHIALRGRNSVNQGDSPLVYVDGVRMYARRADTRPSGGGIDAQYNPLAHIKAEDIERIEVVRGPAATTLYGTEASGGVIQIFTRRGSADLPTQWSPLGLRVITPLRGRVPIERATVDSTGPIRSTTPMDWAGSIASTGHLDRPGVWGHHVPGDGDGSSRP